MMYVNKNYKDIKNNIQNPNNHINDEERERNNGFDEQKEK